MLVLVADDAIEDMQKTILSQYAEDAYANALADEAAAYGTVDLEGDTYIVIPVAENAKQVLLYEKTGEGQYVRMVAAEDATDEEISGKAGLRATAIEEFKNKYGFEKQSGDESGNTVWKLGVCGYADKNTHISVTLA